VLKFLDDAHRFLELFQAVFVLPPAFQAVATAELGAQRQQPYSEVFLLLYVPPPIDYESICYGLIDSRK
jgi:hypothetical protein